MTLRAPEVDVPNAADLVLVLSELTDTSGVAGANLFRLLAVKVRHPTSVLHFLILRVFRFLASQFELASAASLDRSQFKDGFIGLLLSRLIEPLGGQLDEAASMPNESLKTLASPGNLKNVHRDKNTSEPCRQDCATCKIYTGATCYCFKCHKNWDANTSSATSSATSSPFKATGTTVPSVSIGALLSILPRALSEVFENERDSLISQVCKINQPEKDFNSNPILLSIS